MKKDTSIAITGGGIGGLTTAIALHRQGFSPIIYETALELRPIGAGITLAINAMRVLKGLGLLERAIQLGHRIEEIWITDGRLRPINRTVLRPLIEEFGAPNLGIHRGALQQLLLEALPDGAVRLGKSLKQVEEMEEGVVLHFEDGSHASAEIAIAADGIHSAARRQLFPACRQRSSGQVCWRGVCPADTGPWRHRGTEAWAPGKRFGIVPIAKDTIYWFAVAKEKPGYDWAQLSRDGLLEAFQLFAFPVLELIEHTPADQIIYNAISDLEPLPRWFFGRTVLLGDAAHATTPNMGQGACQAIEDAYSLARFLSALSYPQAFSEYQNQRKKRADSIVRQSRRLGRMAQLDSSALGSLRNRLMSLVPNALALCSLRKVFKNSAHQEM